MPIHQRLLLLNQMAGLFHKWQGKRQKGIMVKVLKVLPPASVQVVKKKCATYMLITGQIRDLLSNQFYAHANQYKDGPAACV